MSKKLSSKFNIWGSYGVEKEAVMPLFVTLNHKVLKPTKRLTILINRLRHIINYKVLKLEWIDNMCFRRLRHIINYKVLKQASESSSR